MIVFLYRELRKAAQRSSFSPSSSPSTDQNLSEKPPPCPHSNRSANIPSRSDRPKGSAFKHVECEACKQDKAAIRKYRYKLLFCLLPAFFLASLDLTIVATALPFIASHFDQLSQLNWIVTAFTLTSTAFIPVFGQLADTFGRHASMQSAIVTLTLGSVLCAAAPVWSVLLLGRALQGIGSAGIANVTMIVLADRVTLKEQAITTSIFQLMDGVGYAVGPVIGGYITNASWRYCFVLCIGMGVVSIPAVYTLRKELVGPNNHKHNPSTNNATTTTPTNGNLGSKDGGQIAVPTASLQSRLEILAKGLSTLDFCGIILFILGAGLIILATAWGGSTYPWASPAVLVSLVCGIVFLIVFVLNEYVLEHRHDNSRPRYLQVLSPLLPHASHTVSLIPFSSVLTQKDVVLICLLAFGTGAALYSAFYFIGIYFTLVESLPAGRAGLQLLYYVPGLGVGVLVAIFMCNVYPRQTIWPLFLGTVIETAGMAGLTYAVKKRESTLVNVMMVVAGAGTGARFMPSNLHLAGMSRGRSRSTENAIGVSKVGRGSANNNVNTEPATDNDQAGRHGTSIAPVYSLLRFAQPFGGTLALTIMGSVFQNKMAPYLGTKDNDTTTSGSGGGSGGLSLHDLSSLDAINQLPPSEQTTIRSAGADATMWAFISILPILTASLLASTVLGNVWIAAKQKRDGSRVDGSERAETDDHSPPWVEGLTESIAVSKDEISSHPVQERTADVSVIPALLTPPPPPPPPPPPQEEQEQEQEEREGRYEMVFDGIFLLALLTGRTSLQRSRTS